MRFTNCSTISLLFLASLYKEPEKADSDEAVVPRQLNEKEARELVKVYESQLRRFRIWARDKLSKAADFVAAVRRKGSENAVMFPLRRSSSRSSFHDFCQAG